jgi:hypothetical protein
VLRVPLVFGYLPNAVVFAVMHQSNALSTSQLIAFFIHVTMSAVFLYQHMKTAGTTSIF